MKAGEDGSAPSEGCANLVRSFAARRASLRRRCGPDNGAMRAPMVAIRQLLPAVVAPERSNPYGIVNARSHEESSDEDDSSDEDVLAE